MKRFLALLIVFATVFSLSACSAKNLPEEIYENTDIPVPEEKTAEEKEEIPVICEEMVLNFGAEKNKYGGIFTPKFDGFFENGPVWDFSGLEQKYYFSWLHSYFYKLYGEKCEELFPTLHDKDYGLSYPAEEYEKYAMQFFGTSAEHLRENEYFYCKEHNAYCTPDYFGFGGDGNHEVKILSAKESRSGLYSIMLEVFFEKESKVYELTVFTNDDGTYRYISFLDEENLFYRDILLNFGGSLNHEGRVTPFKFASLFYKENGYADCSDMEPLDYFTWMCCYERLHPEIETIETINKNGVSVNYFPEQLYENTVQSFFEVEADRLRSDEVYDPEVGYYLENNAAGFGIVPTITLVSAEKENDILKLRIKIRGEEENEFLLSVRLLEDKSYKYISFVPLKNKTPEEILCRDIMFAFGAAENANGEFIVPKGQPTAFDCEYFFDGAKASAETYFYWMFHFCPEEAQSNGNGNIYFFPQAFIEHTKRYFGVTEEYLFSLDIFDEGTGVFFDQTEGLHFGDPLEVTHFDFDGENFSIEIKRTFTEENRNIYSVLTGKVNDDKTFRFLSYLPAENG